MEPKSHHLDQDARISYLLFCAIYSRSEGWGEGQTYSSDEGTKVTGFIQGPRRDLWGGQGEAEIRPLLYFCIIVNDVLFLGTHYSIIIGVQKE